MNSVPTDGRRLRYQHRRPELLNVVTAYVLEHGVSDLAMRPLASAIGVSHGTLLHHFGSKENLIAEVVEMLRQRLAEAAGPSALTALRSGGASEQRDGPDGPGGLDVLDVWWRRSTAAELLPAYRLLFEVYVQAVRYPDRFGKHLEWAVHGSRQLMESLVRADGCPAEQAGPVASMIVAQLRGLQLDLVATGERGRVDEAFALFVQMLDDLRQEWR